MRGHFGNLQALRGVACLLVVAYHVACVEKQYGLGFNPLKPLLWFGYAGVDLFFVLSGFIIASTSRADLGQVNRLPRFAFRRLWRIYPTYWAALLVALVHYTLTSPEPVFGAAWKQEAFDGVLLLPQTPLPRFVPVAWSLSYELMFYLAFAGLFLLPRRAAGPMLLLWSGAVIGAAVTGLRTENRFAALALSPYVLEFLLGVLIAWCPVPLNGRRPAGILLAAAVWAVAGSFAFFDPDPGRLAVEVPQRVLVFGVAAALVVFAAAGWERSGGRLGWRRLEAAGDASYSIYLIHMPALLTMQFATMFIGWRHGKASHLAWIVVMTAAGVGAGWLFYRLVERPLLLLAKRKTAPPRIEVPLQRAA